MRGQRFFCLSLFAVASLMAVSAGQAAPKTEPATPVVSAELRKPETTRNVAVRIPQTQIASTIDTGRIAPNTGMGGLLGALIIDSQYNLKKPIVAAAVEKAENEIAPVRKVLEGFDVSALALQATEKGLGKVAWFNAQQIAIDGSSAQTGSFDQRAEIEYRYELSPDFSHIRVVANIRMTAQSGTKSAPVYGQTLASIVQLPKRSYDHSVNVQQWSAEDGKLAKSGLEQAFGRIADALPLMLNMDAAQYKALTDKNRPQIFFAGVNGPLIERAKDGSDAVLLWSKIFISGQTLQPTPPIGTGSAL